LTGRARSDPCAGSVRGVNLGKSTSHTREAIFHGNKEMPNEKDLRRPLGALPNAPRRKVLPFRGDCIFTFVIAGQKNETNGSLRPSGGGVFQSCADGQLGGVVTEKSVKTHRPSGRGKEKRLRRTELQKELRAFTRRCPLEVQRKGGGGSRTEVYPRRLTGGTGKSEDGGSHSKKDNKKIHNLKKERKIYIWGGYLL